MTLFEVSVEFAYVATAPDELTLQVGQIVKVIGMEEEGWWTGELDGRKGVFPSNFVKKIEPVAKATRPLPSAPVVRNSGPKRYRVNFEYQATNPDELTLQIGDIVIFLGEDGEGWWKGELKGKVGVFPSNFVGEYTEGSAPPAEEPKAAPEPEVESQEAKLRKIGAATGGLGSLFATGVPTVGKMKKRDTTIDGNQEPPASPAPSVPPPSGTGLQKSPSVFAKPPPPGARPQEAPSPVAAQPVKIRKAKVTFAYEASGPDELTLVVGETLTVLGDAEEGWWRGTNAKGSSGVFPNNFVEEFWETVEETKPRSGSKIELPTKVTRPPELTRNPSTDQPSKPAPKPEPEVTKPAALPPKPSVPPKADNLPAKPPAKPQASHEPPPATSPPRALSPPPTSPPPAIEKKKFNVPVPQKPAAAAAGGEADNELQKKLQLRSAVADGEVAPNPELAQPVRDLHPEPALKPENPLPPRPARPKPAVATPASAAAPAAAAAAEPEADDAFLPLPETDGPKLQHATKGRPKPSGQRRPGRKSTGGPSVDAFGDPVEKPVEPPRPKPSVPAEKPSVPAEKPFVPAEKPFVPAEKPSTPVEKPHDKPHDKAHDKAHDTKSKPKPLAQDPQTLPELKQWFQHEVEILKKELQEERNLRKALQERLEKLEAKLDR